MDEYRLVRRNLGGDRIVWDGDALPPEDTVSLGRASVRVARLAKSMEDGGAHEDEQLILQQRFSPEEAIEIGGVALGRDGWADRPMAFNAKDQGDPKVFERTTRRPRD